MLEDKIVQRSAVEVLNAIYEVDFLGFSYGFRPGRSQHQALDAVAYGMWKKLVKWVLDADIQSFFDTLSHDMVGEISRASDSGSARDPVDPEMAQRGRAGRWPMDG